MNENINLATAITAIIISVIALIVVLSSGPIDVNDFTPITTEAQAKEFVNTFINFPCEGTSPDGYKMVFRTSIPYDNHPDEFGYYGNKGTTVIDGVSKIVTYDSFAECYVITDYYPDGTEKSGHMVYQLYFDPNNGWVQAETCDYVHYPDKCPKDSNGDYVFIGMRDSRDNPDTKIYQKLPYTGN